MAQCLCSNCDPVGCDRLLRYHRVLKLSQFDEAVSNGIPDSVLIPEGIDLQTRAWKVAPEAVPCGGNDFLRSQTACIALCDNLQKHFQFLFVKMYGSMNSDLEPQALFNEHHTWLICKNHERLQMDLSLDSIFGSEPLEGTYAMIYQLLGSWIASTLYKDLRDQLEDESIRSDQEYLDKIEIQKAKEEKKQKTTERREREVAAKLERKAIRTERAAARVQAIQERKEFWAREAVVLASFKRERHGESADVTDRPNRVSFLISLNHHVHCRPLSRPNHSSQEIPIGLLSHGTRRLSLMSPRRVDDGTRICTCWVPFFDDPPTCSPGV